ncbi:diketogulonate reductase-like aldo/keto reductase [Kushneria sinocarnis]|uniref:Diketogulonate reductase-like aldo/keto reductase n=1 Tax=Kushneria sinocarnis TaxID=595502 RepID=A0A420WSR8_9GAMM|nr:aldo/keto reductase [Kushneria sinocarnis]RKQ95729.1 diketogulonate reductase-like aldo/keto reductase [Kushneria sinocarnis]
MPAIPDLPLSDGHRIPQLGLGTWKLPPEETAQAVQTAFDFGYRHIDTAAIYGNEAGVGRAIARSEPAREQLFITTKLWNDQQGYDATLTAFDKSMTRLGLAYLDLYLIHWPCPARDQFVDTWRAFIRLQQEGRIRSIGVSNFREQDIERLGNETGVLPAINQIELHPMLPQPLLRQFHQRHDIATEAWSPLAQGSELLKDERLAAISVRHDRTPAQIILRWHIELGSIVIPKSATPARMRENTGIFDFELSDDEMALMGRLAQGRRLGEEPEMVN